MAMNYREMKPLCTASEWKIVQESLPGSIGALSLSKLRTKVTAADRLRKKWMDLSRKQKRAAGNNDAAARSMEKARLFADVHKSFKSRLRQLEFDASRDKVIKQMKMLKKQGAADKKQASRSATAKPPKGPSGKKRAGLPSSIKGHISSRNRRDQARRDSK